MDCAYNHSLAPVLLLMLGEQWLLFISETCHFAMLVPPIERVFVVQQDAEDALFSGARAKDFCPCADLCQFKVVIVAKAATLKDWERAFFAP